MKNIDKELLDAGFKTYENNKNLIFQKRYDDEKGKKYIITVEKFEEQEFRNGQILPLHYEYNIQLYSKEYHQPVNLKFFTDWDLDEVEKYIETIWNTSLFDYYEKFDYKKMLVN